MEHPNPYIVVGVGRCGTSTVARVLHTKLNVCMGLEFVKSSKSNPDGTYEDIVFWLLNRKLLGNKVAFPSWHYAVQQLVMDRQNLNVPWGWKDPVTSQLLGIYLTFFDNPKIIRCNRDKILVLQSIKKHWKRTADAAASQYISTTACLDRILKGIDHLVIDFGKEVLSDEYIIERITSRWEI